jgi:mRNA interferase HigB
MRLITRQKLKEYWQRHPDSIDPLKAWVKEVEHAQWASPNDVKIRYPSADPVGVNRVVFNIKGKKYRLVVKIHYNTKVVYVRFIGTHAEYNKINVETI